MILIFNLKKNIFPLTLCTIL